jgi:hypothetical protein
MLKIRTWQQKQQQKIRFWRLNATLLHNECVVEEIREEMKFPGI